MTISRLMLTTALIGTLALPALAQTHAAPPGPSHHATTMRHRATKPPGPLHPIAAKGEAVGTTATAPDMKPAGSTSIGVPNTTARTN